MLLEINRSGELENMWQAALYSKVCELHESCVVAICAVKVSTLPYLETV